MLMIFLYGLAMLGLALLLSLMLVAPVLLVYERLYARANRQSTRR